MKCSTVKPLLLAYLHHELPPDQADAVQQHLAQCLRCRQEMEALQRIEGQVRRILQSRAALAVPPADAWTRLQARLRAARTTSVSQGGTWLERIESIFSPMSGGTAMKTPLAIRVLVLTVFILLTVALPVAATQLMKWYRTGWVFGEGRAVQVVEIIGQHPEGYTLLTPAYLPPHIRSQVGVAMAEFFLEGEGIANVWQAPNGFWLQISQWPAQPNAPLPNGKTVQIGTVTGVLRTGLSGEIVFPTPPDTPQPGNFSIRYENATSLTWQVGNTRLEILANLPEEEILKIAASMKPVEPYEGDLSTPPPTP